MFTSTLAPQSAAAPEALPCPRCARSTKRLGSEWCCWELRLLQTLMARAVPPTMGELANVHFIGRSVKSIDNACRRYGLKTPPRAKRRKRCASCLGFACGCPAQTRAA